MSDFDCEYFIKQKNEGKVLLKKTGLVFLYIFSAVSLILATFMYASPAVFIPLIIFIIALTAIAAFITWRFVCIEYEVIIGGGDIIFSVIYGKKTRKQLCSINIKDISEIGEYDDAAYEKINRISLQKNYICVSSLSAPRIYYALFDEDKDKCIIYFEATDKAIEILKKHNSSAFRASQLRLK